MNKVIYTIILFLCLVLFIRAITNFIKIIFPKEKIIESKICETANPNNCLICYKGENCEEKFNIIIL